MRKYVAFIRCLAPHFVLIACITAFGRLAKAQAMRPAEQVREYEISVSGKLAGRLSQRIASSDDGMLVVSTNAEVKLSYVVYTYRYSFCGNETWRGNSLRPLITMPKTMEEIGSASRGQFWRLNDCRSRQESGHWPRVSDDHQLLAGPRRTQGTIAVLDADQGLIHDLRIDKVTQEQLQLSDRSLECRRFQLVGDLPAELWFDRDNLLVQQQTTEDGRPVEIRLVKIIPKNETAQTNSLLQ